MQIYYFEPNVEDHFEGQGTLYSEKVDGLNTNARAFVKYEDHIEKTRKYEITFDTIAEVLIPNNLEERNLFKQKIKHIMESL